VPIAGAAAVARQSGTAPSCHNIVALTGRSRSSCVATALTACANDAGAAKPIIRFSVANLAQPSTVSADAAASYSRDEADDVDPGYQSFIGTDAFLFKTGVAAGAACADAVGAGRDRGSGCENAAARG
jgi:hypothetical protein